MPSHKKFKKENLWLPIPASLLGIQSILRMKSIESMLLNYIVLECFDFAGKSDSTAVFRKWVKISPSEIARDWGYVRQHIINALDGLEEIGLIETRECRINFQKGREFTIVSNKKLDEIYKLHSRQGVKQEFTPKPVKKSLGVKQEFTPCKVGVYTLSTRSLHLDNSLFTPWISNQSESLNNFKSNYSLNTSLITFIKTFREFENSFIEIYQKETNSQASKYKIKNQIIALIRRYGRFSTFIAMYVNLFSESSQIVDFDALNAFLISNEIKLKEQESKLKEQCDKLYFKLQALMENQDISQDLEILHENFRQNASVLLIGEELEQSSSEIFLYSSFHKDVMSAFDTCNYKFERFTNELLGKINLYCEFKILGMKEGLNYVQSAN